MLNFVFILQNWMYLYGYSNHYPHPLKEKIGSKDSKTRSPQMQMKKVDALTLVRQHTANLHLSKQQIQNLNSEPSKRWLEMLFLLKLSLGIMNLQQKNQNCSSTWPLMEMSAKSTWICQTSIDTACVTDLGAVSARLASVASKNFGTALLLTIREARCTYDASLKKPSTLNTTAQPLPVFDCGFR